LNHDIVVIPAKVANPTPTLPTGEGESKRGNSLPLGKVGMGLNHSLFQQSVKTFGIFQISIDDEGVL